MSELIAGKYRVTRKLDSGGMADVFLARVEGAAGFARTVVIKRLAPALAREPDVVTMFLDEARIAARLHHSNIAQVFDFGSDASGYYLAMEFLAGRDALDLVRAAHPGQLPLGAAAAIVMGAAAGLHHAHEQRDDAGRPLAIVHRDVTSANLFVTVDGAVKVIDFGIARAADRSTVTRTGMVKGTTAYLSPEQATAGPIDRRSDVFQLGIVLYELVTGVRPFDAPGDNDLVIANKIAAGAFVPARARRAECPADLDALIARMLAVDPARRPPTGEAVMVELDAVARRYGWPTSPHELARVVRELAPVPAGGEAPDTIVDGGGAMRDALAAQAAQAAPAAVAAPAAANADRAAILAGLEAPARRTMLEGGPRPALGPGPGSGPGSGPGTAPGSGTASGSGTGSGPVKPRRIAPAVIVAVCLLAGGALLVFAIVAYVRGPHLIVAADTRSESDAAIVVETSDAETTVAASDAAATTPPTATIDAPVDAMPDGSPSAAARCIDEAEGYIQAVRDGLASGDKIRRVREEWAHAKASIGEGVGAEYDKCREARLDRRRDSTDATLDELVVEIKTRESAHQLEYGYIDESGTAIYKDFRGNFLTTEQTDAH